MNKLSKITLTAFGGLTAAAGLGWLGLQFPPRSFAAPAYKTPPFDSVAMPAGLPEPVRRFADRALGDPLPALQSALVWGQARFKLVGLWSRMRFKAHYTAGQSFNRYMEITWFGWPLLKGRDTYRDGQGRLEIDGLLSLDFSGDRIDQAQCLALWAESIWLPAALIASPEVRWEGLDRTTATLTVPFRQAGETLRWEFDPITGLPTQVWARRYRGEEQFKTPWRAEFLGWQRLHGLLTPSEAAVRWEDEAGPYGIFKIEGIEYNL